MAVAHKTATLSLESQAALVKQFCASVATAKRGSLAG